MTTSPILLLDGKPKPSRTHWPCGHLPYSKTLRAAFYRRMLLKRLLLWAYVVLPPLLFCWWQLPLAWSGASRVAVLGAVTLALVGIAWLLDWCLHARIFDGDGTRPGIRDASRLTDEWRRLWLRAEATSPKDVGYADQFAGSNQATNPLHIMPATAGGVFYEWMEKPLGAIDHTLTVDETAKEQAAIGVRVSLLQQFRTVSNDAVIGGQMYQGANSVTLVIPVPSAGQDARWATLLVWCRAQAKYAGNILNTQLSSGYTWWFVGGKRQDGTVRVGDVARVRFAWLARATSPVAHVLTGVIGLFLVLLACFAWPLGLGYLIYCAVRERMYSEKYDNFLQRWSPAYGDTLDLKLIFQARERTPQRFDTVPAPPLLEQALVLRDKFLQMTGRSTNDPSARVPIAPFRPGETTGAPVVSRFDAGTSVATDARWHSLVLPPGTKDAIKQACDLLKSAPELPAGVSLPRGFLLYGPPGTGKTQVARTIANEAGLFFVATKPSELKGQYTGQSAPLVRELFATARAHSPAIVFLDEVDIIAPKRGGREQDTFTRDILGELIQQLDGAEKSQGHVFLLAASNRLDDIDEALLSRLPRRIHIPLPDEQGRQEILAVHLRGKPLDFDLGAICKELAAQTQGLSGRELKDIVQQAEQRAAHRAIQARAPGAMRIQPGDFEEAAAG